ncbi:MAG: RNA-binding S4 domain-containing protein [Sphingomonadales bacterium]|nr:RNA-binding S4 domain-containing protein [Sphingomonadales bacterium]
MAEEQNSRRLDQWLWYARIFKTRGAASKFCQAKKIRIDGEVVSKAKTPVSKGMVLTFSKEKLEKIIKIEALGIRRGPAVEAQSLYEDQSPPPPTKEERLHNSPMLREKGTGRPTKAERRAWEKLRHGLK